MGDRMVVVGPVNGVLKAFRKGITFTKRIVTAAHDVSPATGPLALELAQSLQKCLTESEAHIDAAYNQGITALGTQYADAIINDQVAVNKFQSMTINLLDHFMSLGDYMDEPEAFDVLSLRDIQRESEKACKQAVDILNAVYQWQIAAGFQDFKLSGQGRSERISRPISEVSPSHSTTSAVSPAFPDGRFGSELVLGAVSDSLDSRFTTHTRRDSGTTHGPLQRPLADDRGQLPSQTRLHVARSDRHFSSIDVSSSSAATPSLPTRTVLSEMSTVRYPASNALAHPPLPIQNLWDESSEASAYKSIALPIIQDEHQVTQRPPMQQNKLDGRTDNSEAKITELYSQIKSSNSSASDPRDYFTAHAAASERQGVRISHPSHFQVNIPTGTSYGNYEGGIQPLLKSRPTSNVSDISSPKLIDKDAVLRQVASNETFLEKRRASKTSFRQEMDNVRKSSISQFSTSSNMSYPPSPVPLTTPEFSVRPLQISRPNSALLITHSTSREGLGHANPKTPSPRNSPALLARPTAVTGFDDSQPSSTRNSAPGFERPTLNLGYLNSERSSSIVSEPIDSRAMESPRLTLSSPRQSTRENLEFLGTTPRVPGPNEYFDGKEVVVPLEPESGLMLANEDEINKKPTPSLSRQPVDYPLRHDSSFLVYGGFCESAKGLARGDEGALKVVKKPGGGGVLYISKKCVKCAYEMDFNVWERDQARDPAGIYQTGAINFRQKFLSKCHVATKQTDEPAYACIFCIEEGRTVEEYDATVFFSVNNFFRHLRKHTRPLKDVEGVLVVYGDNPGTVDFDIHFKTIDPSRSPFEAISSEISSRPKATAVINHHPKAKGFKDVDPDKFTTLRFARGARIVGITYPPRFNGTWCSGYHDNEKAHFPVSAIVLEPPTAEDCTTHANSSLYAIAKWDHKPKDTLAGWLTFSKKEKITNIGFKYQEAWCWTGQNAKGKWGFFPSCFVDGLLEGVGASSPRIGSFSRQISGETSRNNSGTSFSLSRLSTRPFHRRPGTSDIRSSAGASSHATSLT